MAPHRIQEVALVNTYCEKVHIYTFLCCMVQIINALWWNNFEQMRHTDKLYCCSSHSLSKHPSREWDDTGDTERDWHYGDTGYLSRAHSATSLQVGWLFAKEKEDEKNSRNKTLHSIKLVMNKAWRNRSESRKYDNSIED